MKGKIKQNRTQRINRTRARVYGTRSRPRLSVNRSNKHINLQLIDDESGKTLVAASTRELKNSKNTKTDQALAAGELLGKKAKDAKITSATFDRRFYKYHGRVKAVADGARKAGLKI